MKSAKDDVAREKAAEKEAARNRELASREKQRAGAGPSGVELDSLISQGRNPELYTFSTIHHIRASSRKGICEINFTAGMD